MPDAIAKAEPHGFPFRPRADDVDRHVGARVRERRVMLGMSQHDIAGLLGVTDQQAYKYERGINRISAGRLHQVARALGVGIDHFYEGVGRTGDASGPAPGRRRLLELARHFAALPGPRQEVLCDLARVLAEPTGERSS